MLKDNTARAQGSKGRGKGGVLEKGAASPLPPTIVVWGALYVCSLMG